MKFKKLFVIPFVVFFTLSSSVFIFAQNGRHLNTKPVFIFDSDGNVIDEDEDIPIINYGDFNYHRRFIFNEESINNKGVNEPRKLWSWSKDGNIYNINGSFHGSTLYTSYYFTDIIGKTFNINAYSNNVSVDLIHRGWMIQDVVYTWIIDAGSSKSIKISNNHLSGFDNSDDYYFRFNSLPFNKNYAVNGTFGS